MQCSAYSLAGYQEKWCDPSVAALAALCLLLPNQIRTLHSIAFLSVVSFVTIIFSVVIAVAVVVYETNPDAVIVTESFAGGGDFWKFFEGLSGFCFAFAGQSIYCEMMAEMKAPREFKKSLWMGTPMIAVCYAAAATIVYAYRGTTAPAFLPDAMPNDWRKRLCSISLFIHMIISYNITNQVVSRALHLHFRPTTVNAHTWTGAVHHACFSFGLLLFSFVVANAIPFFDNLTGVIGALLLAPISLIMPCLLYLAADHREPGAPAVPAAAATAQAPAAAGGGRSLEDRVANPHGADAQPPPNSDKNVHGRSWVRIKLYERVVLWLIAAFGIVIMLIGTISNIKATIEKSASYGKPFTCGVFGAANAEQGL